jgi:hypothetical protein
LACKSASWLARLGVARGRFGAGGLVLGGLGFLLGLFSLALGRARFGRARLQPDLVALLAGLRHLFVSGLGARDFLGAGDALFGDIGQLVDIVQAIVAGRGQIGLVQGARGALQFSARIFRYQWIVLRGHIVAARLFQQAGAGRGAAASPQCQG